jgi:Dyp-type peroxidase family
MSAAADKEVVRRYLDEVLNQRLVNRIPDLVHPHAATELGGGTTMALVFAALPDLRVEVRALVAEGGTVACQGEWLGTHSGRLFGLAPTGRALRLPFSGLFRVSDGRIASGQLGCAAFSVWDAITAAGTPPPAPVEPSLDVDDIQGNIVPGFSKDHQILLLLRIDDVARTRRFLAELAPRLASTAEVLAFNRLFKAARRRRRREDGVVRATWINLAFTYRGLQKVARDAGAFQSDAFRADLATRVAAWGEPRDPADPGHVGRWLVGGGGVQPDLLLIVAADDAAAAEAETLRLQAAADGALTLLRREDGAAQTGALAGHEMFGYLDGVSQPGLRGRASDAPDDYVTDREVPGDPDHGKVGQELIWPGEFVIGYPQGSDADARQPVPPPVEGPAWGRNGSFLVFRRYRQDVELFRRFAGQTAARVSADPALGPIDAAVIGSKLMGRRQDGSSLLTAARDPDGNAPSDWSGGLADSDPSGVGCPFPAHVRKVHPRGATTGDRDSPHRHRMLRRGIPFGPSGQDGRERGLLFLAYVSSIERQFEGVMSAWVSNPDFPAPGAGVDALLGATDAGGVRSRPFGLPVGATKLALDLPDWVIPTGGAYFFCPSIAAVAALGRGA